MSATTEGQALAELLSAVLESLVPGAGARVYVPLPETPNGTYEGQYPYLTLSLADYVTTDVEFAAGGALRGNDEQDPNLYEVAVVDTLVSQSGTTLAATYAFHVAFIEAVTDAFSVRANCALADGAGHKRCEVAGQTVRFRLVPGGMDELRAAAPAIVTAGQISVRQLYRMPR